jgi:Ca2+:H+ antiporter
VRSNKSNQDRESGVPTSLVQQLPEGLSQEDYERAITLTTSTFHNAIRQQQQTNQQQQQHSREGHASQDTATLPRHSAMTLEPHRQSTHQEGNAGTVVAHAEEGSGGGHDAPSWTRTTSLVVLLSCTVLYAIIAEILVDAVDVVLDGSGLDIKLLGVTLFALVPNATEFMNAMSFAINGNIALSMEIGSAYALQVCLIQIPAMVAFSAFYNANREAEVHNSFTLIFPRWDVIAIIFAIFLLTYTYIEARSNYFRGSLLILSYVVLVSGFVFAPNTGDTENPGEDEGKVPPVLFSWMVSNGAFGASPVHPSTASTTTSFGGLRESMLAYPAMMGYTWLKAVVTSLWYR